MEARFWILTLTPMLALLCYAVLLVLVFPRARRYRLYRFFALYLLSMAVWSLGSGRDHALCLLRLCASVSG
jgi:hypothetical protein